MEGIDLLYSEKGDLENCKVAKKILHSRYNPRQEALRIFQQQDASSLQTKKRRIIILIGGALFYDVEALQTLYPGAKILAVYFQKKLCDMSRADISLYYDAGNVSLFLSTLRSSITFLSGSKNIEIKTLYWPAATRIWSTESQECAQQVKETLVLQISEQQTVRHFFSQWLRNACYHYLHINSYLEAQQTDCPVLIAAAGPSLNMYISELKREREKFLLVALASSLACLSSHGIVPDLVAHQDSSYYAQRHLYFYFNSRKSILCMPLNAGRVHGIAGITPLLVNTEQEMERLLSFTAGVKISPYATVLGTAIELASLLSSAPLYLLGADLSLDLRSSHCIPHCNTEQNRSSRTDTLPHILLRPYLAAEQCLDLQRYGAALRQSLALQSYAHWFRHWKSAVRHRIVQVLPAGEYSLLDMQSVSSLRFVPSSRSHKPLKFRTVKCENAHKRAAKLKKQLRLWRKLSLEPETGHIQGEISAVIRKIRAAIGQQNWNLLLRQIEHYPGNRSKLNVQAESRTKP